MSALVNWALRLLGVPQVLRPVVHEVVRAAVTARTPTEAAHAMRERAHEIATDETLRRMGRL
jgi:hypothetical protein